MSHFKELRKLKQYIKLNFKENYIIDVSKNCNEYIFSMIESKKTEKKELTNLLNYLNSEIENIESNYLRRELMNQYENILKKVEATEKEIKNYKNIINI
mgnify:CR=1 FL=1|tara:strand:+ start:657 stop:953 length:297 start_codon:yes stop_codon:yes gene_type:complete